jgi:GNAT superfamily N-acetyltransferase
MALISIAHPRFRKELLEEAKKRAYIYPDQILLQTENHAYPEEEEDTVTLSNGTAVTIRPIKPTDEPLLQDFFYSHSDETVYRRYFRPLRSMPHARAQTMVNLDYKDRMAYVAAVGDIGMERIIAVGRYETEGKESGMIEVAYTVREEHRGLGLGTLLQDRLERYAQRMGFKGSVGYLFEDNLAMLKTFAKKGVYKGDILEDGILRVWRGFH